MVTTVLPNLRTERTVVRLAQRKDRDALLAYYSDNRERLKEYNPKYPDDFFTKPFWERQIERNIEEFYTDASARMFIFDIDDDKTCIGNASLGGIMRSAAQFCYLGYNVDYRWEGCGIMTEAVGAVVRYGFDELKLHRIMANYMPTNEKSGRLLRRLGFVVEGYARDYLYLDGVWQDHIMTSLTNPSWTP